MRVLAGAVGLLVVSGPTHAADFHIDPRGGDAANDGSAEKPWRSLQAVIDRGLIEHHSWQELPYKEGARLVVKNAGAPVKAGDTIWLRSGDHGDLAIRACYNEEFITIAAGEGQQPRFRGIELQSGARWVLRGLHVGPEFGEGRRPATLIGIRSHGWRGPVRDCVVEDCVLQSTADSSGWSAKDWNERACNGIVVDGTRMVIRRNSMKNVDSGITLSASDSVVEHNSVVNFSGDGLRGLGDRSVFQYNVVKNCYDVNDNHDDGFQSWSSGPGGVGKGEVKGMVLRGNTIINYEDPAQPHRGPLQGIGCFDGMFVDWVVENNVIVVDHYHGLTLMGARGCTIVNNTVIDPNDDKPGPAAIRISSHKNGTPSLECTVRNNLTTALSVHEGDGMREDHNLVVKDRDEFFVDAAGGDLRPGDGSPAIDAGTLELAPKTDIAGTARPRGQGVDVGAYER